MFKVPKKDKRTNLEKEIDRVLSEASYLKPDSKEYAEIVENVEKLYKAKSYVKSSSVSPDTIATVVGSLLGIGLIIWNEQAHVITSKALGFVIKGRV